LWAVSAAAASLAAIRIDPRPRLGTANNRTPPTADHRGGATDEIFAHSQRGSRFEHHGKQHRPGQDAGKVR